MNKLQKYLSPALLVMAAMIWGFAFVAQSASQEIPPFTIGAVRSLFASVFLIFVIMLFDGITENGRKLFSRKKIIDFNRIELIGGAVCGLVLALASFFQQEGINRGTEAGKSAFITALYVVLVPVYALALRKRAPINVWISMPLAVAGFYLLCITESFTIVPSDVFVLICALIFPVHILTIDKFSPMCDGIRMSCIQFFTAATVNSILALALESPINFSLIGECIFPLLFLGIGSSGIAYTLQIIGQRGTNPAAASILMSLESVFGVVGGAIFLSEAMSVREYIGCIVVFAAVIISQLDLNQIFKRTKKE
jgi:drug/metabolite transporter (DMT)-like permease